MLLAIDTATRQLGAAVVDGERLVSSYEVVADEPPHAVELPDAVRRVLAGARISLQQVEALIVDIGPGSFTGLRIGLAFMKALACTTKKPAIGVPSLDILAAQLPMAPFLVCPLLDAKRHNVYAALYRLEAGVPVRQTDYLLGPVDDILAQIHPAPRKPRPSGRVPPQHVGAGRGGSKIPEGSFPEAMGFSPWGGVHRPVVFLGDGCPLYRDQIVERLGAKAQFAPPDLWLPRVATLANLGRLRYASGQRDDPATLLPMYLYPRDCSVRVGDRPAASPQPASQTV